MTMTAGVDCGSTYTKVVILDHDDQIVGKALDRTGYKLADISNRMYRRALDDAGLSLEDIDYVVATGFGRHQVPFRDLHVTDVTAGSRGAARLFPETRTILDIGGQTMKACKLDVGGRVHSFRLNDKCAAGTGAFVEKTARYMGYDLEEIGPLAATSKNPVPISGVCAVFAESEVINQLSLGAAPADIMHGSLVSLTQRAVQLLKRVRMEPEYTVVGGILRFPTLIQELQSALDAPVNVSKGDLVQFTSALGAAILGKQRLEQKKSAASSGAA